MKNTHQEQHRSSHRQQKYDAMIQSILDTAREIMREQGVAALSMQELARRMNMRAPSLYHYFNSKMEIYDALFHLGFTIIAERMSQSSTNDQTWQDFVTHSFEGYLSFAKEFPELYQLCFERHVPGFVPSDASLQLSFQLLNNVYQRAQAYQDSMDTDLPTRKMVDLLIAFMHGITAMHLSNEPDLPIGQGRFGSLIPAALQLLDKAWSKQP